MNTSLVKAILHNLGVLTVGMAVGILGFAVDAAFGLSRFHSLIAIIAGVLLLLAGFLLRVWATYAFYEHQMKVIVLEPQNTLLTTGPYSFSRNPLYLGGNLFIFLGAAFVLGSVGAIILTIVGLIPTELMIRREEKQLEARFGEQWREYARHVPRWFLL